MNIKVKYWTGFINLETIQTPGWYQTWVNKVAKADKEDSEMYVFKIPKGTSTRDGAQKSSDAITEIEKLLQEKFGK